MVRLLHTLITLLWSLWGCFNPTMVRLLPLLSLLLTNIATKFQSHNGAIAASEIELAPGTYRSFNPTMVRLLLDAERDEVLQFDSFNPTMVRLLLPRGWSRSNGMAVSIPQWCDCCNLRLIFRKPFELFQSHNGAIAAAKCVAQ